MRGSLRRGDVNGVSYDAEGTREGRYGHTRGPLWVHVRSYIGSRERAVLGLESRAASARLTQYSVTTFSKTCNK